MQITVLKIDFILLLCCVMILNCI